jgi:probable Rubsico expression protein CbbX
VTPTATVDAPSTAAGRPTSVDLRVLYAETHIDTLLTELDDELIGLSPVKRRIREIASFLLVARARERLGFSSAPPTLHMAFTGNPGTGKTTVALRMAGILHRLGYSRKGHLVSVTRDDLVGQYIGHTAPKTKEILKRAMGGVLFIDEAYYLYRPENEKDYGQEAIEILLQVMENQREDLTVILAGYTDRMNTFFQSNPGFRSRIAHHVDFPDYSDDELLRIAEKLAGDAEYRISDSARTALREYISLRRQQANFANARSIRNAFDRARLRQAMRLVQLEHAIGAGELTTLEADDIRASRVFTLDSKPDPGTTR